MHDFLSLQAQLPSTWQACQPDSTSDHVLVVAPSHSLVESVLAHYGPRIPALEHRYLTATMLLDRDPRAEILFVCSQQPEPEVLAYYASLCPTSGADDVAARFHSIVVPDDSGQSLSANLLERPDVIEHIRSLVGARPAYLQAWNVTDLEVEVAVALQLPLYGTAPDLWHLGLKSSGRRLFAEAGVPCPAGREDVRSIDDVIEAIGDIQQRRPDITGVVVKHDDSCAGDGNVVIGVRDASGAAARLSEIRGRVSALPEHYLEALKLGGVVEELITGTDFRSPSAQVQITPLGDVTVVATHEQVLGGDTGQVFTGCRFPADPAYAGQIAEHAAVLGRALAQRGARGRLAVDFAVARDDAGRWNAYALETNIRNGGTTHSLLALRTLVPGAYDAAAGAWVASDGSARSYQATDNMVDVAWLGLPPSAVISAVADAGLQFDPDAGTGVVLHMLSCLAIDGRFGLTAIGHTPEHAAQMFEGVRRAVSAIRHRAR